ncbi:MFS transporter [Paraburkholderia diazotrophica]|uniref:MFS transporter n=1 Tax=Paraburkholderia diazotrophica TaxID=667676 RepID=UPI003174EDA4
MVESLKLPNEREVVDQAPITFSHQEIVRVMFGVVICILLAALDQTAVIPAIPAMAHDLGSYDQLSWIVAAYLITSTVSTPVYAKLSDLYGRRLLLLTCIVGFVTTSVLCGMAQSLPQLIGFRALQGLGGGGLTALTQAAIADVVAPRERGRYQGYISAVWATASLSGPVLGGLVAQSISWRWIFWINLPLGLLAVFVCQSGMRRLTAPAWIRRPTLDIVGMVLLSGALSLSLLALGWGGNVYAWNSIEIFGLVGASVVLMFCLIIQELRARDPLLPPQIFRSSSFVSSISVSTLASVLVFLCLFSIPLYFQFARGDTAGQSGIYVAPFMLASALGNITGSKWAQHFGRMRAALRIASMLSICGLLLLSVLPLDAPLWSVIVGMMVTGFGVGVCLIGSMTSAQNALRTEDIGAGTGALLVLRSVGGASGSTLAGALIASGVGSLASAAARGAKSVSLAAHGTSDKVVDMGGASVASALSDVGHSFHLVYTTGAIFAALLFSVSLKMPNSQLRSSAQSVPIAD